MANTNRDILIQVDVKNSTVTGGGFQFYITDQWTSNFFVKLVVDISTNPTIHKYAILEEASNYRVTLKCKKPNNELMSIDGTLMDEAQALFQYNLTQEQKDCVGTYLCEFWIQSTVDGHEEIITTAPFNFTVQPSIINSLDVTVEDTVQYPIYQELLDKIAELEQRIRTLEGE